jgi:hypothetical protein
MIERKECLIEQTLNSLPLQLKDGFWVKDNGVGAI